MKVSSATAPCPREPVAELGVRLENRSFTRILEVLSLNLPPDLVEFLAAGKQLVYDPDECEAGAIRLLPLDRLKLELFPMFIDSAMTELYESDPHKEDNGYYLVTGVNLVAECEDYDPCGLLMWLPIERRYATWDHSHWYIGVFGPDQTWAEIIKAPAQHINAQWVGAFSDSVPATPLKPWPIHRYSPQLLGPSPFPYKVSD